MKLWLSKNTEIPMREQLVTQIRLGVFSGDLEAREKLPSRQEIARRFNIHANTVSNAYQELAEQGLIEFQQGSGFYVNDVKSEEFDQRLNLDILITNLFRSAQSLGFTRAEIEDSLKEKLDAKPPQNFLVIESDKALREILVAEIQNTVGTRVSWISFEDFKNEHHHLNSNFVALFDEKPRIEAVLHDDETCLFLKPGSIPGAMEGETRPSEDSLIAVVSGWEKFLVLAKTILVAAKIDGDSIVLRSTQESDWKRGLDSASIIICDSLAAEEFPDEPRLRTFSLISDSSKKELETILQNSGKSVSK